MPSSGRFQPADRTTLWVGLQLSLDPELLSMLGCTAVMAYPAVYGGWAYHLGDVRTPDTESPSPALVAGKRPASSALPGMEVLHRCWRLY